MEVTSGVHVQVSPFTFLETVDRLQALIAARNLQLFDVIDHQAAAAGVGLELRPTRVLVFGSPAGGTPLMHEWPALALCLPLRIAVWQGDDGLTRLAHRTREALIAQFDLDPERVDPLALPAAIIANLVDQS